MTNKKKKAKSTSGSSSTTNTNTSNANTSSTDANNKATSSSTTTTHQKAETDQQVQHNHITEQKKQQPDNDIDTEQIQQEQQKGFKGQAKKDLQEVEGYVAEREGEGIDEEKLGNAMSVVNAENQKHKAQKLQKQNELEKVIVSKEDIEFIINEMEVTRSVADRYLRENKGDVVEALRALVNSY